MFLKSNGYWVERVEVGGKIREVSSKDPKKLKKKLAELSLDKNRGPSFEEAADAWEKYHAEHVGHKTDESYRPHVKRAKEYFSNRYMNEIGPDEVQAYLDWLASKGLAKDTVRRAKVTINKIYKYCIIQPGSVVRYNPCIAAEVPRGLKKERREPPAPEEIEKVTPDTDMGLFAWFMMYSGLRNGELLALKWEDIDRKAKKIHVYKSVEYIGDNPHIKYSTKTEAGIRDVDLLEVLEAVLPNRKTGYVFGGKDPLRKSRFYREWAKWCCSVGLGDEIHTVHKSKGKNQRTYDSVKYKAHVTPYQFRHEYASLLEDAGVSEFDAKTAMGHSSITVTKDIYTHIRNRKHKGNLADKMNAYLSSPTEIVKNA